MREITQASQNKKQILYNFLQAQLVYAQKSSNIPGFIGLYFFSGEKDKPLCV